MKGHQEYHTTKKEEEKESAGNRTKEEESKKKKGEILAVAESPVEWEVIPITIDSGAVDTVGPKTSGGRFPIEPTEDSKAGRNYRAANGKPIKNYGMRRLQGKTKDGKDLRMKMVVADVTKVLASVARMCECGNKVVFDEEGSYVINKKTGQKTLIEKRNGAYIIDIWVERDTADIGACDNSQSSSSSGSGFTRLGAEVL